MSDVLVEGKQMFGKKDKPNADDAGTSPKMGAEGVEQGSVSAADYERVLSDLANVTLERDKAKEDYLRALAEYQNYQRRSLQNEQEARKQGLTSVLNSVLPVLDHFDMALNQAVDNEAAQRVVDGVKVIKAELVRALERHGVSVINPAIGDEPDPSRHSVLMHKAAEGVEAGKISSVMQAGYALGDRVIRPAMVTVAPGSEEV